MANIFHSREGLTQGYPLDMVAYRIIILPMIKCLKLAHPDITQPWYSNDAGTLGTFDNLEQYLNSLKRNKPAWGYYPKPTKMILTVHLNNLKAGGHLSGVMGLRCLQAHIIYGVI